jgi:hypothetical protein
MKMKTLMRQMVLCIVFAISLQLMGCGDASDSSNSTVPSGNSNNGRVRGGSWYVTGFQWPHDGEPFESDHFVIYSDGASEVAKQTLAQLAEETFTDIKNLFELSNDVFLYPPGQDKIDIYAYRDHFPQSWGGWAYYGGLLIYSLDHPERQAFGHTEPQIYNPTLMHEMMHVVESLLKGDNEPNLVDVWLTEGLAEAVSGGTAGGSVTDLTTMNELVEAYGSLNPIAMHRYEYPDIELVAYYYYYPMFQLAVEYLIDESGHGKTMNDFKNLFLDVRNGVAFPAAFENRFGMRLSEYENGFFDLMTDYLQ